MYETNKEKQINDIHDKLMEKISQDINPALFDAMFSEDAFELKSLDGGVATFVAESESNAKMIKSAFLPHLTAGLKEILEADYKIEIIDRKSFAKRKAAVAQANYSFFQNSRLQPNFTFDNFVVGPANRDAYLASMFAVENPAKSNPIFLYSKSGLGKTHLIQAIGNSYLMKNPDQKVLYITSDDFVSEFIRYVKGNKDSESLKDFFSTIDLLLVDDIQFLAGKEETQIMFFNVFNLMVSHGKQIVITSDRHPSELKGLQDRLVSRFAGGLSIQLNVPTKNTLVEILEMKIKVNGLSVDMFDPEVLEYLAANYSKNVRELEGAFTNLLFAITVRKQTGRIDLPFVRSVFEADEERKNSKGKVSIDSIIQVVADHFSMTDAQLRSKVRTSQIAYARQIAMYLCRTLIQAPYQEIGKKFGGKDHTTVLSNVQKIQTLIKTDESLKNTIDALTKEIRKQ